MLSLSPITQRKGIGSKSFKSRHEGAVRGYDEVGFAESGGFPPPGQARGERGRNNRAESLASRFQFSSKAGANDEGGLGKSLFFAQSSQQAGRV